MKQVIFTAPEYGSDGAFTAARYCFAGSESDGWELFRNDAPYRTLGPGYRLFAVRRCGICATDLARRHLPFPLPQIIGHEVVADDVETGTRVCLEINDTCAARGDAGPEIFCATGLATHCPNRMVLGIDRLPGGFGPWVLTGRHAAVDAAGLPDDAAVLVEPFAAALHAVRASAPGGNDRVAVLGAGRLGLLITAALSAVRADSGLSVTVLSRHPKLRAAAAALGAHETRDPDDRELDGAFDLVFDATGSTEGLDRALCLSRREVHLKSTTGQPYHGLASLTAMVVDELSLLPFSEENLSWRWKDGAGIGRRAAMPLAGGAPPMPDSWSLFHGAPAHAARWLREHPGLGLLPRFDTGIAETAADIDTLVRPFRNREESLVRPQGAILCRGMGDGHPLFRFTARGGILRTSRCGDFTAAVALLRQQPSLAADLASVMIEGIYPVGDLAQAFAEASRPQRLKIVIEHR